MVVGSGKRSTRKSYTFLLRAQRKVSTHNPSVDTLPLHAVKQTRCVYYLDFLNAGLELGHGNALVAPNLGHSRAALRVSTATATPHTAHRTPPTDGEQSAIHGMARDNRRHRDEEVDSIRFDSIRFDRVWKRGSD